MESEYLGLSVWVIPGRDPTIPRTINARSPHYIGVEGLCSREIALEPVHEQHIRTRNAPGSLERASSTDARLGIWGGPGPSLGAGRHRVGAIASTTAGRDAQSQGCCAGKRLLSRSPRGTRPPREDPQRRKKERSPNPPSRPPHQTTASTKSIRNN